MALQLTAFMGTTAYPDRMGDYYPHFLESGRLAQGHNVSGALSQSLISEVDRDLADSGWRSIFQQALSTDYRFQRGLFEEAELRVPQGNHDQFPAITSTFGSRDWQDTLFTVDSIKRSSRNTSPRRPDPGFEYGWALIKTSAALRQTIQLCHHLHTVAVTDSTSHFHLLAQTCQRENLDLPNICLQRNGY